MRVLWLSMNDGLLRQTDCSGYNGIGWIASLQSIVEESNIELGLAYVSSTSQETNKVGNTTYCPIYQKRKGPFRKLIEYYGLSKSSDRNSYIRQIQRIIKSFSPDLIHLFGIENPLAAIIGETDIPVVVHLQGILGPCSTAFFPPFFCKSSFLWPPSIKEWLLRNGIVHSYKSVEEKANIENKLLRQVQYFVGRTKWDKCVSNMISAQSEYFTVNEVLRESFYQHAGQWKPLTEEFVIVSVISPVAYKGLDLILKTAYLLSVETNIIFTWKVVGLRPESSFIHHFERITGIKGANVNVEYVGVKKENEIIDILLCSSVYVHPSYIENSSNSICEAQMLGIPTIGTYVGGTPSLIKDGETGWLIPANGVYELASLLQKISNDAQLATKVGHNAYHGATIRHNKNNIMTDLMNAYRIIAEKPIDS